MQGSRSCHLAITISVNHKCYVCFRSVPIWLAIVKEKGTLSWWQGWDPKPVLYRNRFHDSGSRTGSIIFAGPILLTGLISAHLMCIPLQAAVVTSGHLYRKNAGNVRVTEQRATTTEHTNKQRDKQTAWCRRDRSLPKFGCTSAHWKRVHSDVHERRSSARSVRGLLSSRLSFHSHFTLCSK